MADITLRQLRYFEALARQGHFGRAADICAVSQPALSVQIKDLEETLGTPLFERRPKQVELTAFGRDFAPRVRAILQSVEELDDMARAAREGFLGRLRLGIIPTIAPYLLPNLIAELSEVYPDLDVHIRETLTERLIEELSAGQIDAAIVALPISEAAFEELPLFEEELVLVRPADQGGEPTPGKEALREMRLLLLEEGHCFRDQALSFCDLRTDFPRKGLDGSSLSTLVQMVGAGIGVTLIPEMAVPVEARSAKVAVGRFETPVPKRTVGMVWRRTSPLGPQLSELSEIVCRSADRAGEPFPAHLIR